MASVWFWLRCTALASSSHPFSRFNSSAPFGVKWLAFHLGTCGHLLILSGWWCYSRWPLIPALTHLDCLFVLDNGRGADLVRTTSACIHVELTGARPDERCEG